MQKMGSYGVVVALAIAALLGFAPTAGAGSAPRFDLTVSRTALNSGEHFTATATATVSCHWIMTWNGERHARTAQTFPVIYTAPPVTRVTRIPLTARCFYASPLVPRTRAPKVPPRTSTSASELIKVVVPPSWSKKIVITVRPSGTIVKPPHNPGGGGGGGLPGTGGPALWVLLAGIAAVLAGAAAVRSSRRYTLSLPASIR